MDRPGIGGACHQSVERVDLANEMAFAQSADRGVARQGADLRARLREQRHARAAAGGSGSRLRAGVPAADDDHIKLFHVEHLFPEAEAAEQRVQHRFRSVPTK